MVAQARIPRGPVSTSQGRQSPRGRRRREPFSGNPPWEPDSLGNLFQGEGETGAFAGGQIPGSMPVTRTTFHPDFAMAVWRSYELR